MGVDIIADIWFSNLTRTRVYKLPIIPEQLPELTVTSRNEEYETFDKGTYNLIGAKGLITFDLESFLPEYANKYPWAKNQIDPSLIVKLWDDAMVYKQPLRFVMERKKNEEVVNMLVSIDSYSSHIDQVGDIVYSIGMKEYRVVS